MIIPLSRRELEVLALIGDHYTTDEVAGALFVSTNTIKTHVSSIHVKLGVNRRADAVRSARELGILG